MEFVLETNKVTKIFDQIFKNNDSYNKMDFANNDNKEIISRLKFIGKIGKNEKINTKFLYVQSSSFFTTISRTIFNQDNRANALNLVSNTVNRIFEIINTYTVSKKDHDQFLCAHIINDLKLSKNGIHNLKETYLSDLKFTCDIDVIIQNIDSKLAEYNPIEYSGNNNNM